MKKFMINIGVSMTKLFIETATLYGDWMILIPL